MYKHISLQSSVDQARTLEGRIYDEPLLRSVLKLAKGMTKAEREKHKEGFYEKLFKL
jgi:hypothetical protein